MEMNVAEFEFLVSNRIRILRAEKNMTQQAKLVGVSIQTIISIETGNYTPSLARAFEIANAFHVSTDDVFQYERTGRL